MPTESPRSSERLESPRVATHIVLFAGFGLLLFLGMSLVLLHFYYRSAIGRAVFIPPTPFARPRLQTSDTSEFAALEAKQRTALQSYAWIDKDKGVIAIPIDDAMKRIVEREGDKYAPIERAAPDATTGEEPKQ